MAKTAVRASSAAPTRELGTILQGVFSLEGMAPWQNFVDTQEFVPELIWPRSVGTFEQVRADSQVSALLKGTFLPLRRRVNWAVDPNGVDSEERVNRLASNLGLPIKGEKVKKPIKRQANRFKFMDHMRLAALAPVYGHYFFEQVGFIDDDGLWTLKRLAERPPRTIADFRISPQDGGLISIIQNVSPTGLGQNRSQRGRNPMGPYPEIPIDNLVGYVWDKEGANWAGRSALRDIYKNWLLKDRLLRIDAINHGRAGGIPVATAHPDATGEEIKSLQQFSSSFRVGDTSGGAIPYGAELNVIQSRNTNVVNSIKYHDESMARNWLLMVLELGFSQSGSRNLGSTFTEFWSDGIDSYGEWFRDTFNDFVIEDYWTWNYGDDDETIPLLDFESDPELNATDLATMVKAGMIEMDDDLEDQLRKEFGLVDKGTPRNNPALTPRLTPATASGFDELGETPDGSTTTTTQQSDKPEGGEQLSQNEKQTKQAQGG
jgi:hypothetical protein